MKPDMSSSSSSTSAHRRWGLRSPRFPMWTTAVAKPRAFFGPHENGKGAKPFKRLQRDASASSSARAL
eukprot:3911472-Alexandrium_andersonii.AAC.1